MKKTQFWIALLALSFHAAGSMAESLAQPGERTTTAASPEPSSLQLLQGPAKDAKKSLELTNSKGETVNVKLEVETAGPDQEAVLNRRVYINVELSCKKGRKVVKKAWSTDTCVFNRFTYDSTTNNLIVEYTEPRMQRPGETGAGTLRCDQEVKHPILLECPEEKPVQKKRVERRKSG